MFPKNRVMQQEGAEGTGGGGAPAAGAPASGAPASGAPASGAPASGAPTGDAPGGGAPAAGAPASGAPASNGAVSPEAFAAIQESVRKLEENNSKLLGELQDERKKVQGFEDAARVQQQAEDEKNKTAEQQAKEARELAEKQQKRADRLLKKTEIQGALAENQITKPAYVKLITADLMEKADVHVRDDGEEEARIGGISVAEYVKNYAATEEGKEFVSAPINSGGGAGNAAPGSGGDPPEAAMFQSTNPNYTELGRFKRENPERYEKLVELYGDPIARMAANEVPLAHNPNRRE